MRIKKEYKKEMTEQYQRVYAEVDLDAVLYNMEQMKKKLAPDTRMM